MAWALNASQPIYTQIINHIKMGILSGTYPAGSRLPSVRDLAAEAAVNPNTMQKALAELERDGLVYSQRTAGRYITEDLMMIEQLKTTLAKEEIAEFFHKMNQLGFHNKEIIKMIELAEEEEQK